MSGEKSRQPAAVLVLAALSAALLLGTGLAARQAPDPVVRILAPRDGEYVQGECLIRAVVEPKDQAVERMTFMVGPRLVCTVEAPPFECGWNAGPAIREQVIRVVAYLPGGRRVPASVRTKGVDVAYEENVDMVRVTVTVTDGTGFVKGLPREAFRIYEDDVRQPIQIFQGENTPLELIIAVDFSDSMTGAMEQVKENVKRFRAALRPTDRVTIVAFNDLFYIVAQPAQDLAAHLRAVDRLQAHGTTVLYETVIRSLDLLGNQANRRGLVVFTDGDDTASNVSREAAERRAEASDAVLYMIGQGRAITSRDLKQLCERLAEKSGGRAFFPARIEELRGVFDQILEELSNQYFLTYAPPSPRRDEAWHRIRVELTTKAKYQVRARKGYRYTTKPPG